MRHAFGMLVGALTLNTAAAAAPEAASVACDISVLVADTDPNGMNVRAAPSTRARVLQIIPVDASGLAVVREQRGAWFRIAGISNAETGENLFRGIGWVHRSLLGLGVANGDTRLYAAPDSRSQVLRTLVADETPITLIGCSGQWAKVRAEGRVGWLSPSGQCSNPLTTCS